MRGCLVINEETSYGGAMYWIDRRNKHEWGKGKNALQPNASDESSVIIDLQISQTTEVLAIKGG